ncbi:PEP-CTERM sorting domain-containing protein [Marinobacter sp.]|uniref:PEP-CTERM sorting domain-containing protein n=1 Tax=Marinobacter sp. TaxID=50741 RepID=UPI0034A2BDCB
MAESILDKEISMRTVFAFMLLSIPAIGVSAPIWNYDLAGKVSGPAESADYLRDIAIGDDFLIKMTLSYENSEHKVSFFGNIGQWHFSQQDTVAFYASGDASTERFYTPGSSSPLNPPIGNLGDIDPVDVYLTFLGFDQLGLEPIPEEQRLVKTDGRMDPAWFHSGTFSFNFWAIVDPNTGAGIESDLSGKILSVIEVPEPATAWLLSLGGFAMVCFRALRRRPPSPRGRLAG